MGAGTDATAAWAAELGMNLQSSTLKFDETGEPFHVQQRKQIEALSARPGRPPATSASRASRSAAASSPSSTTATGRTSARRRGRADQVGYIDEQTRAIFGRSYAAEPDVLVRQLAEDTAIAAADTLLLTVPNQLGVEYNAHVIESILRLRRPGARLALSGHRRTR